MSDKALGRADGGESIVRSTGSEARPICVRIDRAMHRLDIGKTKLYELIAEGELEAIRIGRRTLVIQSSIDALILRLRFESSLKRRSG